MSRASEYFLTRLRNYLDLKGDDERRELYKLHRKLCDGRRLHKTMLSRHLHSRMNPMFDTGIVYLRFAQLKGIIQSGSPETGLFLYVSTDKSAPAPKKKARPA
jgi:hypothetical protein